jgi:hypothetical protein
MRFVRGAAALAAIVLGGSGLMLATPAQAAATTMYVISIICPVGVHATTPAGDLASCRPTGDGAEGRVPAGVTVRLMADGPVKGWSSNCTPMAAAPTVCTIKMTRDETVSSIAPAPPKSSSTTAPSSTDGGSSRF